MTLQPVRWAGLPMLQTVHRLNKRCAALLAETSRIEGVGVRRGGVYAPLELWSRVDARACERAASCPIVLLDLNFQDHDWWNGIGTGNFEVDTTHSQHAHFAADRAVPLLREILMEAWSIGRTMPRAASLIFGMTLPVAVLIASLSAADIHRVIIERIGELRPRWEHNQRFWQRLLEAAVGSDDEALAAVVLYSLQLRS